jgi:hypothetical protein
MRHELAHRDGDSEEADAYRQEIGWYEDILRSPFLNALEGDERAAWDWALQSAFRSARQAARLAGSRGSS